MTEDAPIASRGDRTTVHETSPLLPPEDRPGPRKTTAPPRYQLQEPNHVALLCCLGIFLWVLSGTMAIVPATRIAEELMCHRFYGREDDIDDDLCKTPEVQSSMAFLFSLVWVLDCVAGLVVAFPFGALADRARKPVYILGAIGQSINVVWVFFVFYFWRTLPIELLLLAPISQLLGGGLLVATAVLYAMMSDVLATENRATWFFYFSLSAQVAGFVGLPVASGMMEAWSPWAPLVIVMLLGPLNVLLTVFMPETLQLAGVKVPERQVIAADNQGCWMRIRSHGSEHLGHAREAFRLLRSRSLALIVTCMVLVTPVAQAFYGIFIQYFSMRFRRPFTEAGYILSIRGGCILVIMGAVLPLLTRFLSPERTKMPAYRRDLWLARGSVLCLIVGLVAMAGPNVGFVITGLIISTLGSGLGALCRSLITNFIEPGQTSRLYTLLSILETLGSLPSGPLLAWAFACGMRLQGFLYGLPFLVLALVSTLAVVALYALPGNISSGVAVRTPNDEEGQVRDPEC
ncbi:hypothetical protein JX266_010793 [Neoarthrinium moseri]|nr:hypothetical protein JX266_010793 [Neoarthrinium moseri]